MSAFLVSKAHINYMVNGLHQLGKSYREPGIDTRARDGKMLLRENLKSINHRYPGDSLWAPSEDFGSDDVKSVPIDPVVLLKAIDCYEYQACEHDGWKKSDAHGYCVALRNYAIGALPGYEDAPWGIV